MSEGNKLSEMFQEMAQEKVRANGDEVAIHTEKCVLWGLEHPDCVGCSSILGCCKAVNLILRMMIPLMYQPKSFDDFVRMEKRIQELNDRILNAKTLDELKAVPHY